MSLACVDLRLSINEALAACTINSAFALGVEARKGSLENGKDTDLVIIESDRYENTISFLIFCFCFVYFIALLY